MRRLYALTGTAPTRRLRTRLCALAALLLLAGCGLKPASAFLPAVHPGSIKPIASMKDAKIRVTSKEFTEQLILGKMAVLALTAAGAKVKDQTNVQGSVNARKSIERGDADLMWEYTGTGWITYLGNENPIPDPQQQFAAVRRDDLKRHHIDWMDPAPFNNTYTIAVTQATASKYGLRTLSDMSKVPRSQRTFCVENEFFSRNDGLSGMLKAYDLAPGKVSQMSAGVVYTATSGGTCTFGEVYDTDGRIEALHLKTLADDKHFFPNYNPAITVRQSIYQAHPQIAQIFAQISPKLTTDTMRNLNAQVDVDGGDPVIVARDWMRKQGLIT